MRSGGIFMIGIYKFTSKTTGKSYIGQSVHLEARYQQHLSNIKNSNNQSKWYQALREQGIDNFEYSILEECKPEELNEKEIYWISYFDSFNNGYNSTPGGQSSIIDPQIIYDAWDEGLSPLEIANKLNIGTTTVYYTLITYKNYNKHEAKVRGGRKAHLTAKENNSIDNSDNTIYQYDLNGNYIQSWPSCKEIQRQLNFNAGYIGKCVSGKRKSAYNYLWTNYKQDKIDSYLSKIGKPVQVGQYDLNGNLIQIFPTIKEASQITHTDASLISKVCKGTRKSASGYLWKYIE